MKNKILIAIVLTLFITNTGFCTNQTSDPVWLTQSSGAQYNQRPFLGFTATATGGVINDAQVQIDSTGDWAGGDLVDRRYHPTYLDLFKGMGSASVTVVYRPDVSLTYGTWYVRVMVWNSTADSDANRNSNWVQTTFTITNPGASTLDETASSGDTIRDDHFNDLRTAINNLRTITGCTAYSWSGDWPVNNTVQIKASHIHELRSALGDDDDDDTDTPFYYLTGSYPRYTNSTSNGDGNVATGSSIRAIHINELRGASADYTDPH
ncbi:MAG: hypothetical protein JW871_09030 [Endomicrobiales bacterium]|nr:hypothetical protein [Endomicrobiales bacterium]